MVQSTRCACKKYPCCQSMNSAIIYAKSRFPKISHKCFGVNKKLARAPAAQGDQRNEDHDV